MLLLLDRSIRSLRIRVDYPRLASPSRRLLCLTLLAEGDCDGARNDENAAYPSGE